jgi:DNA-binding CsgD family transcriptional regulator
MPTSKQRRAFERARHDVAELSHRGLSRVELLKSYAEALRPAVHFDGGCWHTVDPASLLITSHYTNLSGEGFPYICANEYLDQDVSKFASLAGRRRPAERLSKASGGELERSARYRKIYGPRGWGSELRGSFDAAGVSWGSVMLLREAERPDFTEAETSLLGSLSRHLAHGLRTAMLHEAAVDGSDDGPGVLVLGDRGEPEEMDAAAERWLAELEDLEPAVGHSSAAVASVAAQARKAARDGTQAPARALTRARSGAWLVLHGSALEGSAGARTAIVLKPAGRAELAPVIAAAYGLTARERELTREVLRGSTTAEIAARLVISPHTVQDHLKAIFEKTGARSRQALIGRIFYEHVQPSLDAPLGGDGWFAAAAEDPRDLG